MAEEKWLLDGPKVIDLGPVRKLKVALVRGQVDIVGHDEPTTRVEVHSVSGKDLRVALTDGVLEIDHPQLRWDNFLDVFRSFHGSARADVSILVPRDIALTMGVVSSTGLVSGLRSDASISSPSPRPARLPSSAATSMARGWQASRMRPWGSRMTRASGWASASACSRA